VRARASAQRRRDACGRHGRAPSAGCGRDGRGRRDFTPVAGAAHSKIEKGGPHHHARAHGDILAALGTMRGDRARPCWWALPRRRATRCRGAPQAPEQARGPDRGE
jgi:hypothetical protein